MNDSSIFDMPSTEVALSENHGTFEPGDAVIILKPDGRAISMTVGVDPVAIARAFNSGELTEEQAAIVANGRKMLALITAASNDQLMAILYDVMDSLETEIEDQPATAVN